MTFPQELKVGFKNFITNRSGLYFQDRDLKSLGDAIAKRMSCCGLDSPVSYYSYLTAGEKKEDEFRELLNLLTVNHTYFFRNEAQFKALKEKVLPQLIARKSARYSKHPEEKPSLRIWSAGCASGEEPYSIAMAIQDAIPDIFNWDIRIFASDASTESLEKAKKGVYAQHAVKTVNLEYLDKYFIQNNTKEGAQYLPQKALREMVNFSFHNLIEDEFPQGFDIIFCRNVMIYFELETSLKIMEKFYHSLIDGGYIFIGYAESLQCMRQRFQMLHWEDAIFYRKLSAAAAFEPGREKVFSMEEEIAEFVEEVSKSEVEAEIKIEAGPEALGPKTEDSLIEITRLTHLKEYERALELIDRMLAVDKNIFEPYYLAAQIYMNRGEFQQAKDKLAGALKANPLAAPAHYLLGCIHLGEEDPGSARDNLKRALYLDKDFSLAHFYLASIYRDAGNIDQAIREYRNTIKTLSKKTFNAIIAYSGGFTAAAVIGLCRDNLERLKAR